MKDAASIYYEGIAREMPPSKAASPELGWSLWRGNHFRLSGNYGLVIPHSLELLAFCEA